MPDSTLILLDAVLSIAQTGPEPILNETPDYLAITNVVCCTLLWLGCMLLLGYSLKLSYNGWLKFCDNKIAKAKETTLQAVQKTHQTTIEANLKTKKFEEEHLALRALMDEYKKALDEFTIQKEAYLADDKRISTKPPTKKS